MFLYTEVVAETESDGNVIRYIRGLGLICSDNEKAKTYYHYASDEMGSITHVVEKANVLNKYEYDAFGNTTVREEQISNRFRFAGQQYDTVTGQYYLRARYYNPVIGRFLQEDNYYGDGLNLYAYCRNNPVSYVDPSGHGTESAATKHTNTETPDQQALRELINEVNDTRGADFADMDTLRGWAEEYGLNPDSLEISTTNEVNGEALREIASESSSADAEIIREWAHVYQVDARELGVKSQYTDAEIQDIIQNLQGDGFKNHPLRMEYEAKVAGLKEYGEQLIASGMIESEVARTLQQARRDLGVEYKHATPQPLRDYIYEVNWNRYKGDKLGPIYDYLVKIKLKSDAEIIASASTPNSNIDKLLGGFEEWLRKQ